MNKIKFWYDAARPQSLPQSVTPSLVGICLAFASGGGVWWAAVIGVVGVVAAHLSVNLLDDYFDYRNAGIESREQLVRAGMRARIGKAPYLANGQASLRQTFIVAMVLAAVAVAIGGVLTWYRGWPIVVFAAIGAFLGYFYSAPPFKLCYHGLGELITGLMFGPLLIPGIHFAVCGHLGWPVWIASVALGMLVTNILYTHSVLDRKADLSVGKKTLAGLIEPDGTEHRKSLVAVSDVMCLLPFVMVSVAAGLRLVSPWMLTVLFLLPLAVGLLRSIRQSVYNPDSEVSRQWWMGPMEQWKVIQEAGIDWFLLRWYLARNLLTGFALIVCIVSIITSLV